MELIRLILGTLSLAIFIFEMSVILNTTKYKFVFKHHNRLFILSVFASFFLTSISILIGLYLYNEWDALLIFQLGTNAIFILLMILRKIFAKKDKPKEIIIEAKKGDYTISTEVYYMSSNHQAAKSLMKLKKDNEEINIIFNGTTPRLDRDLIMGVIKNENKENEFYVCTKYMYKESKLNFIECLRYILAQYTSFLYLYSYICASYPFLITGGPIDKQHEKFLAAALGCKLFSLCYDITKNGKDSYTKFMHFASLVLYIVLAIISLLVWFV